VSMGLFLYEDQHDSVSGQYAAGAHAAVVHGKRLAVGSGVAGWCAANRRLVRNADPAIDLGLAVTTMTPPLRSSMTVPLTHDGAMIGVLSLYASTPDAFTDDHARLLTLLASSLASSIAALPKAKDWTQSASEPRRIAAGGELRLLKR
jgi:GAF domain-containing protein